MTFKITECLRVIQNLYAKPKYEELSITMEAWMKLMCYIHLVGDNEITGIGRIKDGKIIDFQIPKQVVDGTTADATDEAIMELIMQTPIEEIEEWELDWHSHVDMEAFISTTDERNYELMSMAKGNKQFPILVVNKRGEVCFKNFVHAGKAPDIVLTLIEEDLPNETITKIYNKCKEDVLAKVTEKVKVIPKKTTTNWYKSYLAKSNKKNNEEIVNADYTITSNNKRYCEFCGTELITPDEIDNGICEDCTYWSGGRKYQHGW